MIIKRVKLEDIIRLFDLDGDIVFKSSITEEVYDKDYILNTPAFSDFTVSGIRVEDGVFLTIYILLNF